MKLTEIKCNYCGRAITQEHESFVEAYHHFGYGTELDGLEVEFDLCEDCLIGMFLSFKYTPTISPYSTTYAQDQDYIDGFLSENRVSEEFSVLGYQGAMSVAITVLSNLNKNGEYNETLDRLGEVLENMMRWEEDE